VKRLWPKLYALSGANATALKPPHAALPLCYIEAADRAGERTSMNKIAIAAAAAVIVGGGAYYALAVLPGQQFRFALDRTIAELPPGYSVHYDKANYGPFNHVAEIDGLTVQTPAPQSVNETIARITIENPALDFIDGWNKAEANRAALKPDQALPVADRITVEGVKLSGGFANGSIGSSSLAKLRIYPWALLHPGVPPLNEFETVFLTAMRTQATLAAEQQAMLGQLKKEGDDDQAAAALPTIADVQKLRKEQLDALLPVIRLEAAGLLALGYDGFEGSGLDVTSTIPDAGAITSPGNVHIAMAKLHAGPLDRGIGGANAIDGLVEDLGPQGKVSANRASIGDMAIRDAAMRFLDGGFPSMAMLDGATLGPLEFDGMALAFPSGGKAEIEKIGFKDLAFDRSFLKSFSLYVTGFNQKPADIDATEKAMLQPIALRAVTANISAAFLWDPDKKTASVHDVLFSVDRVGSIEVNAELAGIDPADPAASLQASLVKATVRYQDASLINRLLRADGKKTAPELAQMRQQYAAGILATLGPLASNPKLAPSVQAISDFAKTPRNLTITLAPPMPVPVATLKDIGAQGPGALVDALGLSITANQ